jgi:hypothetical protein
VAIPPQFQKHKKGHKAPAKDSKDPKGAPFDAIPSGPMKGQNPFAVGKSHAPAKKDSKAKDRKHFLQNLAQKGK